MVIGKVLLQETIAAGLIKILTTSGVKDIWVSDHPEGNSFSNKPGTVKVEFLSENPIIAKLMKAIVVGANDGLFGHHTLYLAPFQTV